jgi:hypothetical protein
MTDHSATPVPTRESHPELAGRLDLLADTTTADVDAAWDAIQARLAGERQARARTARRPLLAVAVVLLLLLGAATILGRDDDRRVRMEDHSASTDRTTTSTSPRSSTSTTEPAPPVGATSVADPADGATSGGAGGQGAGSPTGQDDPSTADPSGAAAAATTPSGRAAALATWSSYYEVELVYAGGALYFRRVDDVGAAPGPPDGHGYVDIWTPGDVSGARCLASSGGVYQFPDFGPDAYIWGLAGPDIDSIDIRTAAGGFGRTGPKEAVPDGSGRRAWMAQIAPGPVERIEGRDANGNVVATITLPPDSYAGSAGC